MYINIINKVRNSIKNSKNISYICNMKRILVIFVLLVAFNFSTPNPNIMVLRVRHLIEFAQGEHTKSLNNDEMLKMKVQLYAEYLIIISVMERSAEKPLFASPPT